MMDKTTLLVLRYVLHSEKSIFLYIRDISTHVYYISFCLTSIWRRNTTVCQWQFPINCWLDYDD